jgi:hypothetical protein
MKPIRVQRKRTKGFKLPENTVCVTRGTKWGNPFKIGNYYRISPTGWMTPCEESSIKQAANDGIHVYIKDNVDAVELYSKYMKNLMFPPDFKELKGKNLACFCALDKPCHADILLQIANE